MAIKTIDSPASLWRQDSEASCVIPGPCGMPTLAKYASSNWRHLVSLLLTFQSPNKNASHFLVLSNVSSLCLVLSQHHGFKPLTEILHWSLPAALLGVNCFYLIPTLSWQGGLLSKTLPQNQSQQTAAKAKRKSEYILVSSPSPLTAIRLSSISI